jgi:acetolactate synthase-1/2/3 large subunit
MLDEMVDQFLRARKPILAVGLSAVRMQAGPLIAKVAARHGIPFVLTPMAKGLLSEEHPSYVGVLKHALSDQVALTHDQADLVVGIGYDTVEFNYEEWMPEVPLIHVDAEPADIDANRCPNVLNVLGSPVAALERLSECEPIGSHWDLAALARRREEMFRQLDCGGSGFGPAAALSILREALPENGIMTCDVGAHTHLIGQAWRTPHPFGQLMTNGWSSMGFGVPAAIAAKIARPEAPVVCVTGDGGFMMMAGEMATAKRLGLPIVFVILQDRALALIRIKQQRRGHETAETLLCGTEVCPTAHQFGVPVLSAVCEDSYRTALEQAMASEGPTVIEAAIDISEYQNIILRKHR